MRLASARGRVLSHHDMCIVARPARTWSDALTDSGKMPDVEGRVSAGGQPQPVVISMAASMLRETGQDLW